MSSNYFLANTCSFAWVFVLALTHVGCQTNQATRTNHQQLPEDGLKEPVATQMTWSDWFELQKRRAEDGDPQAQVELARIYEDGRGAAQDDREAFRWWLRAAEQGVGSAEYNVGIAYASGTGIERNRDEAVKWFDKAAAKGNSKAKEYASRLKEGLSAAPIVNAGQGTYETTAPVAEPSQEQTPSANPSWPDRIQGISDTRPIWTGIESYLGEGDEHWIESVIDDGNIIKLEDGSLWEVSPLDVVDSALWSPVSDVVVIVGDDSSYPYKLINKDDNELVNARLISR